MYNFIRTGILCVMLLVPTAAWATHPLTVQDTYTEGRGNFLLELTGERVKDDSQKTTQEMAIFTGGVGAHVDLSVEVPYFMLDPSQVTGGTASGIGDIRIKLKHQLFENEVKQSMAYRIYAYLPTGNFDKGIGRDNTFWGFNLIDTQECHSNAFHLNIGYETRGRDNENWHFIKNFAFTYGFAAEHKFTDSFRLLTELAGEARKETNDQTGKRTYSRPITVLAGFVYDISKSWYVDLGARAGMNEDAEDYSALVGTAFRF